VRGGGGRRTITVEDQIFVAANWKGDRLPPMQRLSSVFEHYILQQRLSETQILQEKMAKLRDK
jgi:hypothetical protein